jgi:RHH-type transcriptional regulator, rel operon repressor / antitoxin RelB
MLTLRLYPKLEQDLAVTAKNLGVTKSELIRKSIQRYLHQVSRASAWETGEDLFGRHSSGAGNLSTDRKKIVRDKIRAKRK